jgi:hypothetical protein
MTPLSSSRDRGTLLVAKGDSPAAVGWFSDVRLEGGPLNLISALLLLALAAAPLAILAGWLAARRESRVDSLVRIGGSDSWWRDAMPWPPGVQEDDEVHFNFGSREPPDDGGRGALSVEPVRIRERSRWRG